ncbi:MAG: YraN family protein [Firmicutes bacterium]|nr:YraN family protein [Candidatus Fermentithermobacillaceae bacterium]
MIHKDDNHETPRYDVMLPENSRAIENTRQLGFKMEDLACEYLKKQGYQIKYRNFLSRYGEIDAIGYDEDILAFIEVRYRKHGSLVAPSESIDRRKIEKLKLAIRDFLGRNALYMEEYAGIRVDLCSVTGSGTPKNVDRHKTHGLCFQIIKGIFDF